VFAVAEMLGYRRAEFEDDDDEDTSGARRCSTSQAQSDPLHVSAEPSKLRSDSSSHVLHPSEFSDVALFADPSSHAIMLRLDAEDDGEHVLAEPAKTRRAMAVAAAASATTAARITSKGVVDTESLGRRLTGISNPDQSMSNPICNQFTHHSADLDGMTHHDLSSPTGGYANRPNVVFFGMEGQSHPSARIAMVKPLFGWSAKFRQIRFLWKKATGLERVLILFAIILIVSTLGLFTAINHLSYENQLLHHELVKRKLFFCKVQSKHSRF
jgi:hypothetical protein